MSDHALDPDLAAAVEEVARWVDEAERVVVLTGAGISTDSGIPDFRGPNGVWTKNPKAERTSHIDHYVNDPEVRRISWQQRLHHPGLVAEPNVGHRALVELQRRGKLHTLLTQNIDGLHQAAGIDPALVVEVHGTMREVVCLDCDDRAPMERALDRVRAGEEDPPCRSCGGILKSATISFGQALVPDDLDRAEQAAHEADLLVAVGHDAHRLSDRERPAHRPARRGACRDVNAEPTAFDSSADAVLQGQIADILPVVCGVRGSLDHEE